MARLVVTGGKGEGAEHVVTVERGEGRVTIGRSSRCDIVLSGPGIGRLHATVERAGGKLLVRHQGCIHGTWVNGSRVEEAELADGDELRIGDYAVRVDLAEPAEARPRSAQRDPGRGPGQGSGGESGEACEARDDARHQHRRSRPRRAILGGVRLSRTQQTIIKIVCAGVMLVCVVLIVWLVQVLMRNR